MPIIDLKGRRIKEEDIGFLKKMIEGSLENHIAHLIEWKNGAEKRDEDPAFYDRILQHFRHGLDHLQEKVDAANAENEGTRNPSVQDFIASVYSDISTGVVNQLKQENLNQGKTLKTVDSFLTYCAGDWKDRNMEMAYPDDHNLRIELQDTDEGYRQTEERFHFATEPMEGIDDIEDYDPAKESVAALYTGRSGNSGTLKHTVEEYQAKLAEMNEDHPYYRATKQKLQKAEEAKAGLIMGGETARKCSVDFREKPEVTFGDLYSTISTLNRTVMPGNKQGGKLRGDGIISGAITGSGSFVAPVNLYKTLSKIADGINQVKKVEDPALRKTRAIQLAAFSYQMLVSEHVFPDGNGRTCRLFADTILQTFGLPPHIPQKINKEHVKTLGEPMDFDSGAASVFEGIKKSEQILREERDKAPLQEEETSKARQHLLSAIRTGIHLEGEGIAASEAYRNYIQAMEDLDQMMEELGRKDEQDREHMLTGPEKDELLAKMVRAAETGERFLDSGRTAGKDLSRGVFGMVSRLQTLISRDYDTVNEYKPEVLRSLKALQEDSRVVTIDLRNRNIKTLGHMTSTRIPMTIYGVNGKRRTGVFTKAVKTGVMGEYNAIVRRAAMGCSQDAADELMGMIPKMKKKFIDSGFKKFDDSNFTVNDPQEVILGRFLVGALSARKNVGDRNLRSNEIRNLLKLCNVNVEKIPDKAVDVLTKGLNKLIKNPVNSILTAGLVLPEGTRLDHRNSAMSAVAGLLGAGSLLARSDNVRCIDKDGKMIEGTFMDFGKGLDLHGDPSLVRHLKVDPLSDADHRNNVIRSLVELQIIDYLCLNVDRHPGNLMYQVNQEGIITGIQGIDNDSSFGRRRCSQIENAKLKVISKRMADKVMKLSPEMLRFALRGRGLADAEVTAAVNRLNDLKVLIKNNTVRTVRDDKFNELSDDKLFPTENNRNNNIKKTLGFIRKISGRRTTEHIRFEPYEERPVTLSKVSTTDRKYTVGGMVDLSENAKHMLSNRETDFDVSKINTFGRRSTEFTDLLNAVRNVSNIPEFLRRSNQLDEDRFLSDLNQGEALRVFDEAYKALNEKVMIYLRKKTGERGLDESGNIRGKNEYEKKRIAYAKNVLALVKEYRARKNGPVKKAEKVEAQALKNRRDQNIKNKGPVI